MTDTFTHGTIYAYRKGCRCGKCKTANYRANKRWRDRQANQPVPEHVHGSLNGYKVYGCRCDPCKARKKRADQEARDRRVRVAKLAAAGLPRDRKGEVPCR